jgi:hypothetical protein
MIVIVGFEIRLIAVIVGFIGALITAGARRQDRPGLTRPRPLPEDSDASTTSRGPAGGEHSQIATPRSVWHRGPANAPGWVGRLMQTGAGTIALIAVGVIIVR